MALIRCNKISRTIPVIVHSAANDVVSCTDGNNVALDSLLLNNKGYAIALFNIGDTVTFTSSIGRNPDNVSQYFSKTVDITANLTDVWLMPDGDILYWFGYVTDFGNNGYPVRSGASFQANYFRTGGPGYSSWCGAGTNNLHHITNRVHTIGNAYAAYNNGSVYAGAATSKTFPTNQIAYGATTSLTHWSAAVAEGDYYVAVGCWGDPNRGGDTSAVWVD